MRVRTGSGPSLQFQEDKAEPEATAKAVAVDGSGCSPHITSERRVRGAVAASPCITSNPDPSSVGAVLAPPETSSSRRNTSPVSRPHTVLPVDIGNQAAAQGPQEQAPLNWPLPSSPLTPTVVVPRDSGDLDTAMTPITLVTHPWTSHTNR